ncbi:hypothetical protein PSTG_14679 [Puccinia striiformis f. sp. tritici PST-78]|uniref:Uncharacterized protein n=1 Tax=Puccinia striiformis f. sp. tritici PST-78 TaxID=1165861 RepID=A0A0L0UY38_9BASI|nr:hypothetical protein PSTG_14679 [Puccinia striiformis f. sp. tritici PST-78]
MGTKEDPACELEKLQLVGEAFRRAVAASSSSESLPDELEPLQAVENASRRPGGSQNYGDQGGPRMRAGEAPALITTILMNASQTPAQRNFVKCIQNEKEKNPSTEIDVDNV